MTVIYKSKKCLFCIIFASLFFSVSACTPLYAWSLYDPCTWLVIDKACEVVGEGIRYVTGDEKPVTYSLSKEHRWIALPESIYMQLDDNLNLDRDNDGLKDDYENRLADTWRPYFVFDEEENALGDSEPLVLFRVYPTEDWFPEQWPRLIRIQYAFLWEQDGGYEGAWLVETNSHWGDTASGGYILKSWDGINWGLETLSIWDSENRFANDSKIEWTEARSTYWGEMEDRPSPIMHFSSGKHHIYMTKEDCEDGGASWHPFEDEDCDEGGNKNHYANLTPAGTFTNVGEPSTHSNRNGGENSFVTNLSRYGYNDEYVWWSKCKCSCDGGDTQWDCFTGGKCGYWPGELTCVEVTPVYKLVNKDIQPGRSLGISGEEMAMLFLVL